MGSPQNPRVRKKQKVRRFRKELRLREKKAAAEAAQAETK